MTKSIIYVILLADDSKPKEVKMNSNKSTLVMIKPDAPKRGLVSRIMREITGKGFTVTEVGSACFSLDIIQNFYRWEVIQCPEVVNEYLCGKKIPLWIIQGINPVNDIMEIKLRLRKTLCRGDHRNLMHCSSSYENFTWEYQVLNKNNMISIHLKDLV